MKRILFFCTAFALVVSCTKAEDVSVNEQPGTQEVASPYGRTIEVQWDDLVLDDDGDETKTYVDYTCYGSDSNNKKNKTVKWLNGDKLGVWPVLPDTADAQQYRFTLKSGGDAKSATFTIDGWEMVCDGKHKYSAYYPYDANCGRNTATITYPEVLELTTSLSTTDFKRVGNYMYMYASPVTPTNPDSVAMKFKHLSSLATVVVQMPDTDTTKGRRRPCFVTVTAPDEVFVTEATYNPTSADSVPSLTPVKTTDVLKIRNQNGIGTASTDKYSYGYYAQFPIPMYPAALNGKELTIEVEFNDGAIYDATYTCGKNQVSGTRYRYKIIPTERVITDVGTAVDLGLSVDWSDINLGATKPEEVGFRTAWGVCHGDMQPASISAWTNYIHGSYTPKGTKFDGAADPSKAPNYGITKYNATDKLTVLVSSADTTNDDDATARWGSDWKIPTAAEFKELLDSTTRTEETVNGVAVYKFTSKVNGYTDKYIYIPKYLRYWTSSVVTTTVSGSDYYSTQCANCCLMDETVGMNTYARVYWAPIRPVKVK